MTSHASIALFKDVCNRLGIILKQLAIIAEDRKEEIIDKQSTNAKINDTDGEFERPLAEMLAERSNLVLNKTSFRLAVVGTFNAGKSSLINALLERDILSVHIQPRTAAKTILRYDERESFAITPYPEYSNLWDSKRRESHKLKDDIVRATSDNAMKLIRKEDDSVAKQIAQVEIWCKSPFLKGSYLSSSKRLVSNPNDNKELHPTSKEIAFEVIDTPGLGSPFEEHKVVTYKLIPEVDAILLLFPVDPGMSENDLELLEFIRQYVHQILFVMTKIDRVSEEEWKTQREFAAETVRNLVGMPIDRLYAVSSVLYSNSSDQHREKSGFSEFIEGLETFLVSARGVSRLHVPFDIAKLYCEQLISNTQLDLKRIDDSVETLRAEMERLKDTKKQVEQSHQDLISKVDNRVSEMTSDALYGIEKLPTLLRHQIHEEISNFNRELLKRADVKVQTIINTEIDNWVQERDARFRKEADRLQNFVDSRLQTIVEQFEQGLRTGTPNDKDYNVPTPDASILVGKRSLYLAAQTVAKAGGTFLTTIGLGGMLGALTGVIFGPLVLLLAPLAPIIYDLMRGENRLREDIKKQLDKPLPHNSVTIFEAVVEGFSDKDEQQHAGLRELLQGRYEMWGSQLKSDINTFVDGLANNQLHLIERQIADKETNRFDREESLRMHTSHEERLKTIHQQLIDLRSDLDTMGEEIVETNSQKEVG